MIRTLLTTVILLCLPACSVAVYTPIYAGAALGMHTQSLAESEPYRRVIDRPIVLADNDERYWSLRRFEGGRYFIEFAPRGGGSVIAVCPLGGRAITITAVYEDTMNGGIHYAATVQCDPGSPVIRTKRNGWYSDLLAAVGGEEIDQ